MKKVLFVASMVLAVLGATFSGVSAQSAPAQAVSEPTITCDATNIVCATIGPVVVYGLATIHPGTN